MKTKVIILALALGASTWLITAQDGNQPADGQRPPHREGGPGGPGGPGGQGGFHLLPPRAMEHLNLTEDQQKQIAALEAEVKAKLEKILTPEQLDRKSTRLNSSHLGNSYVVFCLEKSHFKLWPQNFQYCATRFYDYNIFYNKHSYRDVFFFLYPGSQPISTPFPPEPVYRP